MILPGVRRVSFVFVAFCLALWFAPRDTAAAQAPALTASDSALIRGILIAEDARDAGAAALLDAQGHASRRIQWLAQRARGRIRDSLFAARDSLPPLPPPRAWLEPAWKKRYRALAAGRDDCARLRAAIGDSAWPVRLRAIDLLRASCAADDSIARALRSWVDALPGDASRRGAGHASWHAAAHALVALARTRPLEARPRTRRLATHPQWQVRAYAARAAAVLSDTASLRALARDADDNVKEVAIEALSKLTGHADDDLYVAALSARGAQAVRAAALALQGSPRPDVAAIANAMYERWVARDSDSERDVRLALLEAAGRPAADDRRAAAARLTDDEATDAVALALGRDVRLRVTLSRATGGGAFVVRLRGDVAPITAARVLALVRAGYYDGTDWHRVEHDFVVQGLGHGSNEYVGHRRFFRDELGTVPHARGTVGMSTRGHDTGDAQWFINLKDNLRLGGAYTVFADVVEGMDVVDGIMEGDRVDSVRVVTPR